MKENMLQTFSSKNYRMVQEWVRFRPVLHGNYCIYYKGWTFSVCLLMNLYLIFHYFSGTATHCLVEVESNDGSHLESLDALGLGRRILKKVCTRTLTAKR